MARSTFGGRGEDFLFRLIPSGTNQLVAVKTGATTLTAWSLQTGGTRYTDLQNEAGGAITEVTVTDYQIPRFKGPDGVSELWLDSGDGTARFRMTPTDSTGGGGGATDLDSLTDVTLTSAADSDILQRKTGIWVNRTMTQLKADLNLTTEDVQDLIGAMVTGNNETGIAVTYDDVNGKLDFVVSGGGAGATDLEGLTDVDLTTPADDDILQRKAGLFVNRTLTQLKTDLALTTEDLQDMVGAMVTGNTETNIAVTYNDTTGKLDFVASAGGGGTGDTVITLAPSDVPNSNADYQCDGTADSIDVQAAYDLLPTEGGEIVLLPGHFIWSSTVKMTKQNTSIRFISGAWGEWSSVTGRTPLIQMLAWYCTVHNARLQGSGSKGNGIGVLIGGQASTEPIVGGSQVHGCHVVMWNGRLSAMDTGIEFGIQSDGTGSSGDNFVWGGRYSNVKTAIESAGFVNYAYGLYIANVNVGIRQTAARSSGKVVVKGAVINEWGSAAIELLNGRGSIFDDIWAEHVSPQSTVATEVIRIAPTGSNRVRNPEFGFLHIHPIDVADGTPEVYGLRLSGNVEGMNIRHLEFTDELPSGALIRQDSTHVGGENIIQKISIGDTVPSGWSYSKLLSNASATGVVVVREIPSPAGSAPGTTVGARTPAPALGNYLVDVNGTPNAATYWAKRFDGHIAYMSSDTGTTSGLKAVLENLQADGIHYEFGPGRFHFLDSVTGVESWAGVQDHPEFSATGLSFIGSGIDTTYLSNRSNYTGSTDTEVFSFSSAQDITIKNMTVETGGFYKTTTDCIDLDLGCRCLIERVRIRRSRSRGIVFDGGDAGKNAVDNIVRDVLIQGRPEKPQLATVSGGTLTATTEYRYAVSWMVQDLAAAGTAGETKVSEVASVFTDATNKSVRIYLKDGPYGTTERRIYRAPAGSSAWVRAKTIADNTTTQYIDTGTSEASVTMPVSLRSTIYQSGVEFLGSSGNKLLDSIIDGIGDDPVGVSGFGVYIIRKGSGNTLEHSDKNLIQGVTVRDSISNCYRISGGSDNEILDSWAIRPGTNAAKTQAARIDSATAGVTSNKNVIRGLRVIEDQDANSPSGGQTMSNAVIVNNAGTAQNNIIEHSVLDAGASTPVVNIVDATQGNIVRDNPGHNPQGPASITVGASPFTYTGGPTPEMIYISGGTVSLITKAGTTLFTSTDKSIRLEPNQAIIVTYSSAPTMNKDRL